MAKLTFENVSSVPTPATGKTAIYVDSADKHTKQIDDTGAVIDLTEEGNNDKVKASSNDSTADYLLNKVVAADESNSSNILEVKEVNDGGDEDLKIAIDETKIDHDNLTNYVVGEHTDAQVKVSSNDSTPGYLEDKIVVGDGSNTSTALEKTILNDGADEDVQIQFDETKVDHDALLNYAVEQHRVINDVSTSTTELFSADKILALFTASFQNRDHKDSVLTVSTSNITLSGEQTLNGVLTSASRVGVVGQTDPIENGIYVSDSGAWTRTDDADGDPEVTNGLSFFVADSTSTKLGSEYLLITPDPIVVDTTGLTFIEVPRIELGTTSGTAAEGDDSRIPAQDENDALVGTNGAPSTSNKYVTNSDPRNSDARTPTAHESTHNEGGSDPLKLDDLAIPDDNTDLDASTSKHGLMQKYPGGTSDFLRGDGTFAAPPGAASPLTTKGDLFGFSTVDARVPVGTNGQRLEADSTAALGVKWADEVVPAPACYGSLSMEGNSTATTISTQSVPVKAAGTTTAELLQDFTHTSNKLTYTGTDTAKFLVNVSISIQAGINNDESLAVLVYKNGVQEFAEIVDTCKKLSDDKPGQPSNTAIVSLAENDYIEIWVANNKSTENVTVKHMNVTITSIGGNGAQGADGATGATGATGAGANIIVQKDDVTVGTVTDTLNFEGSGVSTVVDEGSDKTTVTITGGGSVAQLFDFGSNEVMYPTNMSGTASSRNGHSIIDFDDTDNEEVIFEGVMSNDYLDGNISIDIFWTAASTSGNVKWDVSFERMNGDIDTDSFAAVQTATAAPDGTSGIIKKTTIVFTQAQADSIAAGELMRIKVARDASAGADTMTGDAELLRAVGRQ